MRISIKVRRWIVQRNRPNHKGLWSKVAGLPANYVGANLEETRQSCVDAGCSLLPVNKGGTAGKGDDTCYAWTGTPYMGLCSMERSQALHGFDPSGWYSLEGALARAPRLVGPRERVLRYVREAFIGDPSAYSEDSRLELRDKVRSHGLIGVLSFTHLWRSLSMQPFALASCESLEEADKAIAMGYRASVVLPWQALPLPGRKPARITTPQGVNVPICPAMLTHKSPLPVLCNDCGWCDPQSPGPEAVGFPNHDPRSRAARLRTIKATTEGAK